MGTKKIEAAARKVDRAMAKLGHLTTDYVYGTWGGIATEADIVAALRGAQAAAADLKGRTDKK